MKKIFLLLIALIAFSCGDQEKESQQKLFKDVMAVHDEVMPKMSDIHTLKKELEKLKNQTESDSAKQEEIIQLVIALGEANESMMQWMRDFEKPDETLSHDEIIDYLDDQMIKIKEVKDNMEGSIKNAKSALN